MILRKLAARLPRNLRRWTKSLYYGYQIRSGIFRTSEPEFDQLSSLAANGDWVLDIGANVGHYTIRLSKLVGESGRVVAFEPVPETFEMLTKNVGVAGANNVTLINAAVSQSSEVSGVTIPKDEGSESYNFYLAHLTAEAGSAITVLCIAVDALDLPHRVRLVKIDTEGHELAVLRGMRELLKRDCPILIVEDNDPGVLTYLESLGYTSEKLQSSSNRLFRPNRGSMLDSAIE